MNGRPDIPAIAEAVARHSMMVKSQKCWIFLRGSAPFSGP